MAFNDNPPDSPVLARDDHDAATDNTPRAARRPPKSKSPVPRHGLNRLRTAVRSLGGRVIDRRTALGKALAEWRQELIKDLGGLDTISTQERAIIDLAVRTRLLLDSVDAWLLTQPSLINKRARALLPVVRERQQLADGLSRYLQMLGLGRRAKPALSLDEYIKTRATSDVLSKPGLDEPELSSATGAEGTRPASDKRDA
jgi:hypothetical protein